MKGIVTFTLIILSFALSGQQIDMSNFEGLKFRNIGPAGMSGRVTAIDVNLRDKDNIFIGSASGGVWESKNGGITWKPIFDEQSTLSIGSLEINQNNPAEIWVGTGEGNPRNSHNSGKGIFRSLDGGATWKCMGLEETKLIHRVIYNSTDKSVLAGALGSAWGPSSNRGVFKSKDGGRTWKKTLYVSDEVGVADMVVDPSNPNKIIAAMWEFGRKPYGFNSGGKGSGLYISYDGGDNWTKITEEDGLPKGNLGRMGLAFAPSKPNIVYALIEAKKNGLYKSIDGGKKWKLVSTKDIGNRPFYYSEIYVDPNNENRIYNLWSYVSLSEDGGKTFKTIMDYGNDIHPDHHAFWIDPDDSNYLIDGNDGGLNISRDGSKTWRFIQNLPLGQFYHVDVDDDFPYKVYGGMQDNGSWVGPGFSLKRGGINNQDWQELYFGDGFDVAPKVNDNRYGYAMSQGGYLGMWDKLTGRTEFIKPQHPEGKELRYNWNAALALDPFNEDGVYYGSQYVHKSTDGGHHWKVISPDLTTNDTIKQDQSKSGGLTLDVTGAENYTTILAIAPSPHDQDVIWASTDDGNLQVTRNGGQDWSNVSSRLPGLPKNAWIPQIELSKVNKAELFVVVNNYRQNDWSAYLYHSKDKGATFRRIANDTQIKSFVCSVVQDTEQENLLFLGADDGLYYSIDYGKNWIKWSKGLPPVQIRDMKIQSHFGDLVLGTFGRSFWVLDDISPLRSLAKEGSKLLNKGFKVFEPQKAYLTSNRSYQGIRFKAQGDFEGDNRSTGALLTVWKKPTTDSKKKDVKVSETKSKSKKSKSKKKKVEAAEKDIKIERGKKEKEDEVKIYVINSEIDTVRTFKRKIKDGMNRLSWYPETKGVNMPRRTAPKKNREPGGMPILPGTYKLVFEYDVYKDSVDLEIALDPRIDENKVDTKAKYTAMSSFNQTVKATTTAFNNLKDAKKSMDLYNKIIEVQPDSSQKEIKKLHKSIGAEIDSLMNIYMLPKPDKPEYRSNDHTLMNQLWTARRYLGSSDSGPTKNGQYAIDKAEKQAIEVIKGINTFFDTNWSEYVEKIKALPLDIFKDFDKVKIE